MLSASSGRERQEAATAPVAFADRCRVPAPLLAIVHEPAPAAPPIATVRAALDRWLTGEERGRRWPVPA